MARFIPWRVMFVALAGAALAVACGVSDGSSGGESVSAVGQTIMQGTLDGAGEFPAVARVLIGSNACSGTLVSPNVVLTAAHCFGFAGNVLTSYANGCGIYAYQQPKTPQGAPLASIKVQIPTPQNVAKGDPLDPNALVIGVDALDVHPGWMPNVPATCCPLNPASCAGPNPLVSLCASDLTDTMHDVAVLHLERAVPSAIATPMKVLAKLGPAVQPGQYPVNFASLVNAKVTLVGTSLTSVTPNQPWRAYGTATVSAVNGNQPKFGKCANSNAVPPPPTVPQPCTNCYLFTSAANGGACAVPGDSGGPVVLNATSLGASAVPGLGSERVIAGVDSSGPKNFSPTCNNSTDVDRYCAVHDLVDQNNVPRTNGSWILEHLVDFDGDGWFDDKDNCPLVANADQANCNADAELKWGFPVRGDACDPIPCAHAEFGASRSAPMSILISDPFVQQVITHVVKSTFSLTPLGSGPYGNGASLGAVLPPANVGTVTTHYRFCQKNPNANIDCGPGSFNNAFLNTLEGPPLASRPYHQSHASQPPVAAQEPFDYPSASILRTWDYAGDCASWVANSWIAPVSCASDGLKSGGLDGRFWIDTDTGKGTFSVPIGTGYRVNLLGTTDNDDELHNSYYELAPDIVSTSLQGKPLAYQFFFKWWLYQDVLSAPPQWDGASREVSFIVPAAGGHAGIVRHDGAVEVLDGSFGPGLESVFANPAAVIAGAVDPSLGMGPLAATNGTEALIFAADGTRVIDGVGYNPANGTLGTTGDLGIPAGLPLTAPPPVPFVRSFGTYGSGPGQLNFPVGIGLDAQDNAFVVDRSNHRVCKFGPGGDFLLCWGKAGTGDGEFGEFAVSEGPYGLEVDKGTGRVYVADTVNSRVQCFDGDGTFLFKFGGAGSGPGQFAAEVGLGLDPQNHDIYVADTFNHRIQVFDSAGGYLRQWGSFGAAPGQLAYPRDVAVDSGGNVYVAEYDNSRISKFDRIGNLLSTWGSTGSAPGQFHNPHAVAVDAAGRVYVGDLNNNRVQVFTPAGALVALWGGAGAAEGQFQGPIGLDLDAQGQVYVTDHFNHRVEVFAPFVQPPPRTGFFPVFSRVEQRAFVIGGADPTTGVWKSDAWMLGPSGWSPIPLGTYDPQNVLAATWSFTDHRLWILDKAVHSPPVARLVRVEPGLGHVQVVGEWPWTGTWDRHYLVIDAHGQVILASSSTSANKTTLIRFHVAPFVGDAEVTIDSVRTTGGALALPPIADLSGTTLFRFNAKKESYVVRRRTISGTAAVDDGDEGDKADDGNDKSPKKKDKKGKGDEDGQGKAQPLTILSQVF